MIKSQRNLGLDIGKFFFALLIPFLHIPFPDSLYIEILRQYLARLGVPFFFAVSGYFLSCSVSKLGRKKAFIKYLLRIGLLLIIWLLAYLPLYIRDTNVQNMPLRTLLFKTPAYLWYLTALLFGSFIFCLVKKRKILYFFAALIYIVGTLLGGSYSWAIPKCNWYLTIFLTTRNGLFFALPIMCLGEFIGKKESFGFWKIKDTIFTIGAFICFCFEVLLCRSRVDAGEDCSMYLMLPVVIIPIFKFFSTHFTKITICDKAMKYLKLSSAIYLLQYGVITLGTILFNMFSINNQYCYFVIYLAIIFVSFIFVSLVSKTKLSNYVI